MAKTLWDPDVVISAFRASIFMQVPFNSSEKCILKLLKEEETKGNIYKTLKSLIFCPFYNF